MKALITGATGLIGSYLAEKLIAENHQVRVLIRPESDRAVLKGLPVEYANGDLRNRASLDRAVEGVDVVFHAAARMSDWGDIRDFYEDNVQGTLNLMRASLGAGVKRFVHTSSTGVLGLGAQHNSTEEGPYDGEGVYEVTKVEAEKTAVAFGREHPQLPVTVIRPSWTLGPRARRHIPLILDYLQRGILLVIGNGRNVLTFVDPRDVADAMLLAAENPAAAGQTYHITNGDQTHTQRDCYAILARELGVKPPRIGLPFWLCMKVSWLVEKCAEIFRFADAPMCTPVRVKFLGLTRTYSCEKAQRELGYRPRYTLEQSLKDAVAWYREEQARREDGRVRAAVPKPRTAGAGSSH
jgi:nucleoside-diphosphate-sugar epimerase